MTESCERHGGLCVGYGHDEKEPVYDTRFLTDEQRSLADDIASAMGYGHEDTCAVWWKDPDGCSCPLLQAVADGLEGARVVEIIQEWGYDPVTRRGDRLHRQTFRPHPLSQPDWMKP
jgi:hypothetical protein